MARIFMSYASERHDIADEINLALVSRNHQVFFDRDDLPEGETFENQIEKALKRADLMVFLISPESVKEGRFTRTELKYARDKWPTPNGRVLPVLVAPTPMSEVPAYLKTVTILEASGSISAEVASAVDRMLAKTGSPVKPLIAALMAGAAVAALAFGVYTYDPFTPAPDLRPDPGPETGLTQFECNEQAYQFIVDGTLSAEAARLLGERCAQIILPDTTLNSPAGVRSEDFIADFARSATSQDRRERLAAAAIVRGDIAESSDSFLALARASPDNRLRARYYRAAGTLAFQEQPEKAIESFEALVAIEPDDLSAWSALSGLYMLRGDKENAERASRVFAERASEAGPDWRASALLNEAFRQMQAGQAEAGLDSLNEAKALFEQTGNRWGVAQALINEGEYWLVQGQFGKAGEIADDALTLASTYGFADVSAQARVVKGRSLAALMRPEEAGALFRQAEEEFEAIKNPRGALFARTQRAQLALQSAAFAEARNLYSEVREINQETGFRDAEAWALLGLGQAEIGLGDLQAAEVAFASAEMIFEEIGSPIGLANAISYQSNLDLFQGRPDEALARLSRALAIAQTTGNEFLEGQITSASAFIHQKSGRNEAARQDYERTLALYDAMENRPGSMFVLEQLGHVCKAMGDMAGARAYWTRALGLGRALDDRNTVSRLEYELGRL